MKTTNPKPEETKPFGELLRIARKAAGMNQHEAAAFFGVSTPTYIHWENRPDDAPPPDEKLWTQERIIDALVPSFPEKLRALRKHKRINQHQLGDMLGVSNVTIGFWEAGERLPYTNANALSQGRMLRRLEEYRKKVKDGKIKPLYE